MASSATPTRPSVPPGLVLVVGILAVSTASLFIRWAQQDAPSLVIAAYRLVWATLLLAPGVLWRHGHELRRLPLRYWLWALLSGAFLAAHFAVWITSLEYTTVASSVVLVTTTPLWVALTARHTLQERLSGRAWLGIVVALAGGVIIALGDGCRWEGRLVCAGLGTLHGQALWGDLLALSGAWAAAAYLSIGRHVRSHTSFPVYLLLTYGMAALVLAGLVTWRGLSWSGYRPATYGWFLALALIPQLLGHSAFNWALRHLPASVVSLHLLGEPVGSTLLALFFLGEVPSPLTLLGSALVLGGLAWVTRQDLPTEVAP